MKLFKIAKYKEEQEVYVALSNLVVQRKAKAYKPIKRQYLKILIKHEKLKGSYVGKWYIIKISKYLRGMLYIMQHTFL